MKIRLSISLTYIDAQSQFTLRIFRLVYVKSRRLKLDPDISPVSYLDCSPVVLPHQLKNLNVLK